MSKTKKTFIVRFPIVAGSFDRVDLEGEDLKKFESLDEKAQKEFLFTRTNSPSMCHECSDYCEDPQAFNTGEDCENVDFYEEEES